jgi:hypothetical protein
VDKLDPQSAGTTFRDYFENFLWARDWVIEKSLQELGFKLLPDGSIDPSRRLEDVKLAPGKFAKTKLPSGNRMVLLGTRFGAVALHEYWADKAKSQKNLTMVTSDKIAHFRFIRPARTAEDQLRELLMVFGFPERQIKNLHEFLEELFGAVIEVM